MILAIIIISVVAVAIGTLAFILHKKETSKEEVINKPSEPTPSDEVPKEEEKEPEKPKEEESKPKFKVGDWITNGDYTWKIVEVEPLGYILQSQNGNIVDDTISHIDKQFHSFTIEDAKDGDVLACPVVGNYSKEIIFILKRLTDVDVECYCCIDCYGNFDSCIDTSNLIGEIEGNDYIPATKEQRDILFQKMKEDGYEWSDKDRKLIKIVK